VFVEALTSTDPTAIGTYAVLGRLGAGGMGVVYLGRSAGGRLVAIKVVRARLAQDPEFRVRFGREVAAARAVSGAFTAAVIDADTQAASPWLVTAFVPGFALDEAVQEFGPCPPVTVRALAASLAEALRSIHAAGLVHRDLKPANVLLAGDGPRVIDFGIARAAEESKLTQTGTMIGSPGFMSPEQASGQEVGTASDVFSLAALLAYTATGQEPFGGGGAVPAQLYRVIFAEPHLDGITEPWLRTLIEMCLDKQPERRPSPGQILDYLATQAPAAVAEWLPRSVAAAIVQRVRQAHHLPVARPVSADHVRAGARFSRRAVIFSAVGGAVLAAAGGTAAVELTAAKRSSAKPSASPVPPLPAAVQGWQLKVPGLVPNLVAAGGKVIAGSSNGQLLAVDPATGRPSWTFRAGGEILTTPLVSGELVCIATPRAIYGVSAANGKQRWRFVFGTDDTSEPGTIAVSVLASSNDVMVVATTISGTAFTYYLNPKTGKEFDYQINNIQQVGSSGTVIYWIEQQTTTLKAYDVATKKSLWEQSLGNSTPVVANAVVVVDNGASLYGYDAKTGATRWNLPVDQLDNGISRVVLGSTVFISHLGGQVVAVDANTGRLLWPVAASSKQTALVATMAVAGDRLYVARNDNTVTALSTTTGATLFVARTSATITTIAAVGNTMAYATADGSVQAVSPP
jgi:outer membrane protein assembly factor BamB/predicted Ser/Thr protein kinase